MMKRVATILAGAASLALAAPAWASGPGAEAIRQVEQYNFSIHILAMLLVGFGFLMVFVKRYGYSATTGTYLVVGVGIPIYMLLRSTGVPWDLRRAMPYLRYDEVEFDVIVGTFGDNFDRYSIRLNEIRESIRIIRQIVEKMPAGDYRVQDKKVTPPPRGRIDESMEALIHHFKVFTEGFRVPEGEVYVAIESPRGELGCYLVSDGGPKPFRMHIRGPSFVNLQALPLMMRGGLLADAVVACSSVDPVMGEVDR